MSGKWFGSGWATFLMQLGPSGRSSRRGPGGRDCDPEAIQGPELFLQWLFNHQHPSAKRPHRTSWEDYAGRSAPNLLVG